MKSIRIVWVALIACTLFFSCKDELPPPVSRSGYIPQPDSRSGPALARSISVMLTDPEFRSEIKNRLVEKFDGDYNFLLSTLPSLSVPVDDPLLQLAMPSLEGLRTEHWDPADEIPLVVYRPEEADLNTLSVLTAFQNGEEVDFDITREPDHRILVLSHNERVLYSPKNKLPDMLSGRACAIKPVLSDPNFDYYLKEDVYNCGGEVAGGSDEDPFDGCNRDRSARHDHITRAKFATINIFNHAEHYLDGNPEVFFIVTLASKNPSGFSSLRKSYPSRDRSEWKDCGIFRCDTEWFDKALPVFNWDRSLFGDLVRYDWFEEDYSKAKIDLTLGLSTKISDVSVSGGVKITINEKDYFLDQDFVGYCDETTGIGTTYNTGKLYFSVNQQ